MRWWRNRPAPEAFFSLLLAVLSVAYPVAVFLALKFVGPALVAMLLAGLLIIRILFAVRQGRFGADILPLGLAIVALAVISTFDVLLALKFYPVILSVGLGLVFAHSMYRPPNVIERFARAMEPRLNARGVAYTRNVALIWIAFFVLNALIAAWLALFASVAWWTLYTGLIAYGVMACLFLGEFAIRQTVKKHHVAEG